MKAEITITKQEAQEKIGAAITPALFNRPMRITEVKWESYGSRVTIECTDEPEPVKGDEA